MSARRITDMMAEVVEEMALAHLAADDDFDFDVGITHDPDGTGAWAIFRLECPESGCRSVMGINAPLQFLSRESFRHVVEHTLTEMQFARIATALEDHAEGEDEAESQQEGER